MAGTQAKDATTVTVRRGNATISNHLWAGLLWGLALLGLLLLPSDYRAGAEAAHGHALAHLWLDAADGAVRHHRALDDHLAPHGAAWGWLDPAVNETAETGSRHADDARPDVAEHQDSASAGGGVHLLVKTAALFVLATAQFVPVPAPRRAPEGRVVRVLLPPPRWTPLAG